mmetsp:Transcript_48722/g.137100  ORF Transcript_48722/g.137100 Transcript_48722/m.137100 type:complete len:168 (-) Transcript_48722:125-628(-)|eukprot:CAMPEP_0119483924 /NCGR_PEP_ID=MMETSP1344-20130328/11113_1 /TAXON_ID=236787 /ORGANISM="Florenciella parvula, Strain CCMP2471" /LENGTH=167 /DNA_ID=CAMNT_0007518455 /DNA_START=277 /DNA_END=780 /DNA_ORIENTATION=+
MSAITASATLYTNHTETHEATVTDAAERAKYAAQGLCPHHPDVVIRERTYNMFGISKGWKLLHESCPQCDKERKTGQQAAPPATPAPPAQRARPPAPERAPATTARSAPTRPPAPPEFVAASSAATPQATEVQEAVPAQPAMMDVMLSTTRDGHFADVRGDDSNARS